MSRGKGVQEGVRVRPQGVTWDRLAVIIWWLSCASCSRSFPFYPCRRPGIAQLRARFCGLFSFQQNRTVSRRVLVIGKNYFDLSERGSIN